MPIPLLALAIAATAAKAVSGEVQANKAKKEAAALAANRPLLGNNSYAQDQLALTGSELARGNNTPGMQAYDESTGRDLSTSIGAILKGGGDVNNVADLFSNSNQGRQRALLMSDNLRLNQINNYIRSSQYADNANQQQFQFNQFAPWADKAQATANARLAANNKIWGAVDEFGSAAMQYGSGNGYNNAAGGGWKNIDSTNGGNTGYNTSSPILLDYNSANPNNAPNWNMTP